MDWWKDNYRKVEEECPIREPDYGHKILKKFD